MNNTIHTAVCFSLDAALAAARVEREDENAPTMLPRAMAPTLPAPAATTSTPFVLHMTENQAQCLAALLSVVSRDGEGYDLDNIYMTLVDGGAEVDHVNAEVAGGFVVVSRDSAK